MIKWGKKLCVPKIKFYVQYLVLSIIHVHLQWKSIYFDSNIKRNQIFIVNKKLKLKIILILDKSLKELCAVCDSLVWKHCISYCDLLWWHIILNQNLVCVCCETSWCSLYPPSTQSQSQGKCLHVIIIHHF